MEDQIERDERRARQLAEDSRRQHRELLEQSRREQQDAQASRDRFEEQGRYERERATRPYEEANHDSGSEQFGLIGVAVAAAAAHMAGEKPSSPLSVLWWMIKFWLWGVLIIGGSVAALATIAIVAIAILKR